MFHRAILNQMNSPKKRMGILLFALTHHNLGVGHKLAIGASRV
jgi:hypothetical protein